MVQAYGLATPLPCRRPKGWALARLSKSEAHYCVPMSAHIPRSPGRAGLLSWRLLDGICLSLTTTKSAMMLIVLIDCFVLLRSPFPAEE